MHDAIASLLSPETVTAISTVVLAVVTALLAIYTRQLADVTRQPSVIALFEPSRASVIHFDLHVANEGTAAAYDVQVEFDPSIPPPHEGRPFPLTRISVLRAGQQISSYAARYADVHQKLYKVKVSWTRRPNGRRREQVSYPIDMRSFEGRSLLGGHPDVMAANELKKLREAVEAAARGSRRMAIDVHDARDRLRERRDLERAWRRMDRGGREAPPPDVDGGNSD